jgi:EAL domain-containing protein (putative c-di-GMP-specific phosphodiesterase class I)
VVAEGVENVEQRRVLADLGCDVQQGHLVAPPLDEQALLYWAQQRQTAAQTVK